MKISAPLPRLASAGILCLVAIAAPAQRGPGDARLRAPLGVAISPDAKQVAWVERSQDFAVIKISDIAGPSPATDIIPGPGGKITCSQSAPVWSPDSSTLAFTSDCGAPADSSHQQQIFLWSRGSRDVRQLTHVKGLFKQAAFSPDGKSIAFLFVENASRSAGALDAMKPWAGVIGEDGVEIQRVYAVNVAHGTGGWITAAKLHAYEFDWAPDSKAIAFIAANPPGENTWWVAKLYAAPVITRIASSGANDANYDFAEGQATPILDPVTVPGSLHGLQIAVPRYSPDGKHIAFIGGLMSDQGSTGGDIYVVPSAGGEPVNVTPTIDGTPTYISWTGPDNIGFTEDRRGHMLLADASVSARKPDAANDLGQVTLAGGPIKNAISVSTHGTLAFIKSGIGVAPEIWAGPFAAPKQFTHLNDAAPKSTARIESLEWDNEGFHVQGWLTFPKDFDPAKKYPMIVTVHGGPSAAAFARGAGQWSELGYFEFQPNPRGSFGQGEKFTQANRKDFGYGDLRDILSGIDAIEKKYPVDDHRLGLTGWSYGGFMSMFASTQTNRFRAIVAGAGISNWQSYYGENSIDQWMIPFFGASVYDDPAVYAKSSAITFIKKSRTPMLIIVGDRDGECPAPQSFEMWHALRDQGVKTQLVIYPNEGHGFRDPAHIKDRNERTQKWFAENLK